MNWLVRVVMPHAVFGFIVDGAGNVCDAAPICRWAIGKRGRSVVGYFRARGGEVEVLQP